MQPEARPRLRSIGLRGPHARPRSEVSTGVAQRFPVAGMVAPAPVNGQRPRRGESCVGTSPVPPGRAGPRLPPSPRPRRATHAPQRCDCRYQVGPSQCSDQVPVRPTPSARRHNPRTIASCGPGWRGRRSRSSAPGPSRPRLPQGLPPADLTLAPTADNRIAVQSSASAAATSAGLQPAAYARTGSRRQGASLTGLDVPVGEVGGRAQLEGHRLFARDLRRLSEHHLGLGVRACLRVEPPQLGQPPPVVVLTGPAARVGQHPRCFARESMSCSQRSLCACCNPVCP